MRSLAISLALALTGCTLYEGGQSPDDPADPPDDPTDPTDPTDPPDPPEPPEPGGQARAQFEQEVYPILAARCGACHDGGGALGFVSPDPAQAYETILASYVVGDFTPEGTPLVQIQTRDALHPPTFTAAELEVVLRWLAAEREGL